MDALLSQIGQQGVLFAGMALVIIALGRYVKASLDAAAKRENEREDRYNTLTDAMMTLSSKQVESVTTALVGNTEVLRRVERKLDETSH